MKVIHLIGQMGTYRFIRSGKNLLGSTIEIDCSVCGNPRTVTVGAVYKQHKRGKDKYICPSCSGKSGWTAEKRQQASERSARKWDDPGFAGVITGKAMAREIKKEIGDIDLSVP